MSPRTLALMRWSNRPLFAAMHESGCGTNRTSSDVRSMVAIGRKADMARNAQFGRD
jgi:hypothetical protein